MAGGWRAEPLGARRPAPAWLAAREPLTTGLLAQTNLKLWTAGGEAALALRAGAIVYPVLPEDPDPERSAGARALLRRLAPSWCVMGPSPWVDRVLPLLPPSRVSHHVDYAFLARPAGPLELPAGEGELRLMHAPDAPALFALQEAYEKEEVLFDPAEFQPLVSRLNLASTLSQQVTAALWHAGRPLAKAGTNALTAGWAQLGGVYTRPEWRGRGLQKRLLAFLLNQLTEAGRSACLFVKTGNAPARGLYQSLGFAELSGYRIVYGERVSGGALFP